jgi:hypothetical protein
MFMFVDLNTSYVEYFRQPIDLTRLYTIHFFRHFIPHFFLILDNVLFKLN